MNTFLLAVRYLDYFHAYEPHAHPYKSYFRDISIVIINPIDKKYFFQEIVHRTSNSCGILVDQKLMAITPNNQKIIISFEELEQDLIKIAGMAWWRISQKKDFL